MEQLNLIEGKIEEIRSQINEKISKEEYHKLLEPLQNLINYIKNNENKWVEEIINLLLFVKESVKSKIESETDETKRKELENNENKIYDLIEELKGEFLYEPDKVIETLKRDGLWVSRNGELKKAINGIGFKLLEKVRLGQRDEVMYLLLRTFMAQKQKMPESLVNILKVKYDDGLFKSFVYAFLSPILGE